jgi:dihydrolipoamide dehydrogenase
MSSINHQECDVAVLGGGPGGYPAAIKAAQHGAKVILIEAKEMGGTCLNRGCIPTKTLLSDVAVYESFKSAKSAGIFSGSIEFHYNKMVERKQKVVDGIRKSLEGLVAANKIEILRGFGKFTSPHEIKVTGEHNTIVRAKKFIIATGSEPLEIGAFPFDHERILSSTSILELKEVPKTLAIIGAGYIGCEFTSLFSELGTKVILLEAMGSILPNQGQSIQVEMTKAFNRRNVEMGVSVYVEKISHTKTGVKVHVVNQEPVEADFALVAIGRKVNVEGIGLESAGVKLHERGYIVTDEHMETNVRGIYAVGDVTGKWMLAHVASHQGLVAAENAMGHEARIDYRAVPAVVFTSPEIGFVGYSLEEAINKGFTATVGTFPFQALGKSQASRHTDGFAQIVIEKGTGQILGAQVVGHEASTLIAEMAIAIHNELTVDCITETIHAHPTLSESWAEAAFLARGTPLHFPPSKKRAIPT